MKNSTPIHRPELEIELHDGKITVRDLPWQDARQFINLLATHSHELLSTMFKTAGGEKVVFDVTALLPLLKDVVTNVDEVSTFLLTKSSGKDKEWLDKRGTIEILALMDAALEVNISDGLIELGKKVGGRLGRVFAATTSTTPASATS